MAINLKTLNTKSVSDLLKDSSNIYLYALNTSTNVGNKVLLSDITKEQAPTTIGKGVSIFKNMGSTGLKMNLRSLSAKDRLLTVI